MKRPLIPLVEVTAPNGTKSLLAAFSVSHRDAVATVKKVIPSTYAAELSNRRVPPRLKFGGAHPGDVILIEQIPRGVRPPFAAGRDRAEGEEMTAPFSRVYALEVDGRPVLAFEAGGNRKAQQICNESWLLDDLSLLRSGGVSLRTAQSKLSVRPATPEEAAAFGQAAKNDNLADDMPLVYLNNLDGQENRS